MNKQQQLIAYLKSKGVETRYIEDNLKFGDNPQYSPQEVLELIHGAIHSVSEDYDQEIRGWKEIL